MVNYIANIQARQNHNVVKNILKKHQRYDEKQSRRALISLINNVKCNYRNQ